MITGRKRLDAAAATAESPLVSLWRAVIPAVLALALGAYLWSHAHFAAADAAAISPTATAAAGAGD
jgi:hypothetical protein